MISIQNTSARAGMHSFREFFLNDLATCRASLRRIAWINSYSQPTSVFSFVGGVVHELVPRSVTDAFRKTMISKHVCDRQVFERDEVVLVDQLAAKLVGKVGTSVCNSFAYGARDNFACLASSETALRLCGKFALRTNKVAFIIPQESRIVDLLASAKSCKRSQPNVYSNLLARVWQDVLFRLAHDQDEPFARSVGKGHRFDLAFGRTMKDRFDVANELKVASEAFDLAPVAIGRIFNRLELSEALETRESGLLARLNAAKEGLVALIESAQCRLQTGIICIGNIFVSRPCALKPSGLLDIPNTLFCRLVDKLAFIQRRVIQGAMRFDHGVHSRFLCACWVKAKLESLNHDLVFWLNALPLGEQDSLKHCDNRLASLSADPTNQLMCFLPNTKVLKLHVIILLQHCLLVKSQFGSQKQRSG